MDDVTNAHELAVVGGERTQQLLAMLGALDDRDLEASSLLPGWSRLTIVCHLRYGARAMLRITQDALEGRPVAYYPQGRDQQRPGTLAPELGEHARDVLEDWRRTGAELDAIWGSMGEAGWAVIAHEPEDNPDLGPVPLARFALARLTEVDVHGTDLDVGFPDWSATLVRVGLPTRLAWLETRRTNHREFDRAVRGTWLLESEDGFAWTVRVDGDRVESRPFASNAPAPRATIRASRRDLLALLLGRPPVGSFVITGDSPFGESFSRAFPGP